MLKSRDVPVRRKNSASGKTRDPLAPFKLMRKPRDRRDALIFLAMVMPNLLLILFFTYRPLVVNM